MSRLDRNGATVMATRHTETRGYYEGVLDGRAESATLVGRLEKSVLESNAKGIWLGMRMRLYRTQRWWFTLGALIVGVVVGWIGRGL